ncbi:MAG: hypothetical protein NZO58_08525 [Gemmataceae bacterium]|nr:hypothetical protein [Gemmataceae bacterium]
MINVLLWKEIREHRVIWLTMVVLTGLLAYLLQQLGTSNPLSPESIVGVTALAMAAVYGVVCGSMMLAGEREEGTLVLLDVLLGRRGLLWTYKAGIGVLFVLSQALTVAAVLTWLRLVPPEWIDRLLNQSDRPGFPLVGHQPAAQHFSQWFLLLPLVTFEAYCWGLLASSLTQRVLTSAGAGLSIGFLVWWALIALPPPASLILRVLAMLALLAGSAAIFYSHGRDQFAMPSAPLLPLGPVAPLPQRRAAMVHERPRVHRPALVQLVDTDDEIIVVTPVGWRPPATAAAREVRPAPQRAKWREYAIEARSPAQVVWWLTWQQGMLPLMCLALGSVILGLFLPRGGAILWPIATLLLGVACGTATFAWEQADQSYQFLAAQRFPLMTIRNIKLLFWSLASLATTLLLFVGSSVRIVLESLGPPHLHQRAARLEFGALAEVLGPTLFLSMWLVYGFAVGQLCVFYCRRTVYAVVVAVLAALGALVPWLPSLLCRGLSGWQVWLTPLALLLTSRWLLRAWAGGWLKESRSLVKLIGVVALLAVWWGWHMGRRAWEIPAVSSPLDREAYRSELVKAGENPAGPRIREALLLYADAERGKAKNEAWLGKLSEAVPLPPGVLEAPSKEGHAPMLNHLASVGAMADELYRRAVQAGKEDKNEAAHAAIAQALALSRSLRCKAPLRSYEAGVEVEATALKAAKTVMASPTYPAEALRRLLGALERHAAETPGPRDCLEAECYRAGGLLQNPAAWNWGNRRERWFVNSLVMSLDTPWETERSRRLWEAVWDGLLRGVDTPHWEWPGEDTDGSRLLDGWLPNDAAADAALTRDQLERFLHDSWLEDPLLFAEAAKARALGNRSRWQIAATQLTAALLLYQRVHQRPARQLDDLVPQFFKALPVDPYSGRSFLYRIANKEWIEVRSGPHRPMELRSVAAGEAVVWSTGPDRTDNGGRVHYEWCDRSAAPVPAGCDLVAIVPKLK